MQRSSPGTVAAAACLYGVLTLFVTYPLAFAAGSLLSRPIDDPLLNTWILWWNTQAWPLTAAWWNAPMFYPSGGAMAFSELLIGLLPITAPLQWLSGNPVIAYNAAVLLSFPLCALAAHALALELTGRHDAALLAGLAFGFSPYRANEIGHLQMISYYWAPIALLALHRYRRDGHRAWLAVFAAAWLMQSLTNGYAIFHLSVLIVIWIAWFSATAREALAVAAAWACGSIPLVPVLMKYREVQSALHLERSIQDIRAFSADVTGLLAAPSESVLWGGRLLAVESNAAFPGMTIVLVLAAAAALQVRYRTPVRAPRGAARIALGAAAGLCAIVACSALVAGPWSLGPLRVTEFHKPFTLAVWLAVAYFAAGPRLRRVWRERAVVGFYVLAAALFYVLSLGPEPTAAGVPVFYKPPYSWLLEIPGFSSIRTPVRFAMVGLLCLAMLMALVYARWVPRDSKRRGVILTALVAGLIADAWIRVGTAAVPAAGPRDPWPQVSAVLELPMRTDRDTAALYRSIGSGMPLVNGASGYSPPHYYALVYALTNGHVAAVRELARKAPIGIAIDRTEPEHDALERAVSALEEALPLTSSSNWARYVIRQTPHSRPVLGRSAGIKGATANSRSEDVARLADRRVDTHWSSGTQQGSEELLVELEREAVVASVVLEIGSCPFGFPRDLAIDVSRDGVSWTAVWRGSTAVATVRAALDDPTNVPLLIEFDAAAGRFVRLRQLARDASVPWCVAEIALHEPS